MKRLLIYLFLFPSLAFAQHDFYAGVEAFGGIPFGGQYGAAKQVLYPSFSGNLGGNFLFQYLFAKRIGIDLGIGQNFQYYHFKDKLFKANHQEKFEANIYSKNYYPSVQASVLYIQPIPGSYMSLYIQGGYLWNFMGPASTSYTKSFTPDGQELTYSTSYPGTNNSILTEIGVKITSDDEYHVFTIGLKGNWGLNDAIKGSLRVDNGASAPYQDNFSSNGSFIGLSLKYHFQFAHIERKPKVKYIAPVETKKEEHTYYDPSKPQPKDTVQERKKILNKTIPVTHRKIKITIVEQYREDGDKVSLQLNGKWILQNYVVMKKPYTMEVELYPGENELVFHAENLGSIPPNTATIFVEDGNKKYNADLRSTMETSEVIKIVYEAPENK